MLPDRVSNPGPLTYESGALPIALRGPGSHIELSMDLILIYIVRILIHIGIYSWYILFAF